MGTTLSRTITVSVVWLSVGMFLTFGLPNIHVNTGDAPAFFGMVVFICIAGAAITSAVLWLAGRRRKTHGRAFEVIRPAESVQEVA